MALEQTTIPEIGEAIVQVRRLSADEKVQQEAWYREKQLLDEASALDSAYRRGFREGFKKGFREGFREGREEEKLKRIELIIRLVKSGTSPLAQGAKELDMPVAEFEKLLNEKP